MDNARVSGDDDGELPDGGGGDEHGHDSGDEELPDGGHSSCSHSNGSLVARHFQSSNIQCILTTYKCNNVAES